MHYPSFRTLRTAVVGILLLVLALALTDVRTVRAATVTANIFTDPVPGACASSGMGNCSLREAVIFANANPNTPMTIMLLAGIYLLTIGPSGIDSAQTGDLNLTSIVTIIGAGAGSTIIDGSGMTPARDRILSVENTIATISGVTIQGGQTASSTGGGGIVTTNSTPRLTDVVVSNNAATNGKGGGIAASGTDFTFTNVTLNGNIASGNGGGLFISNTTVQSVGGGVTNNHATGAASAGGGIGNDGSALTIANATVSGNSATNGGGIANITGAQTAIVTSTVSGNRAITNGGGVLNSNGSTMYLQNSTISGNSAATGGSGYNIGGSQLNYSATTIAMNTSGVFSSSTMGQSSIALQNTILANTAADCTSPDGSITSSGYNLFGDSSCTPFALGTDLLNINPRLGPLQLNAPGTTATHAVLSDSPAVNRIPNAGGCGASITTDQRGVARPQPTGSLCDIGAYELKTDPLPPPQPTGAPTMPTPNPLPVPPQPTGMPLMPTPNPLPPRRP
ncbi:MAG: choice-of-anchor Q domain-containing protein [Thermomicrobiales bacterium]